jgi:uncharacterized protein YeaO (DUF488 family)
MIKLKRAYEPVARADGYRVLVDRLWPRGIKKADFALDEWAKELAPSNESRKAFGHEASKWKEFRATYRRELRSKELRRPIEDLARRARRATVTLLYGANDEQHNNAVVLKAVLEREVKKL